MILDQREIEAGATWARGVLNKAAAPPAEGHDATATRSDVQATRRDLATPGAGYAIGAERYAADGSLWRRTA